MNKTKPTPLIGLFLLGGVGAYLTEILLQSRGGYIFVPPITVAITLTIAAVAVILLALPIRRRVTGKRKEPVDPLYAARVLALAKASSLAGSLLLGVGIGIAIYLFGRPIAPTGFILANVITHISSALLLIVAGLIAENLCVLPPEDKDEESLGEPAA